MSAGPARSLPTALDRMRELANIGAGHAATALAQLVRRTIHMDVPSVDVGGSAPEAACGASGGSAICFGLEGGFVGDMAVVFSRSSLEVLVSEVMGADAYGGDTAVESAVREAGNILVSHYASAIADTLHACVLPTVPLLTEPHDLDIWVDDVGGATAVVVASSLYDDERELEGYLLLVPGDASLRYP
jgi:chemotaxis protein CheC